MAAKVEPGRVQAACQSLHHFVAKADWCDDAVLEAIRTRVLPVMQQRGAVRGWMVEDTGMPKKGVHSVGIARQYCGQLGKQDNCQVAVILSLATDYASLPIAHRLYLPQACTDDTARRVRAGVPDEGIAARLASLIADPRNPLFVTHSLADILRARMLAIACGHDDADDLDHLRTDPGFKLACGGLPDSGRDLCSQPTVSRWENAPTLREVMRMIYAKVDLYCAINQSRLPR